MKKDIAVLITLIFPTFAFAMSFSDAEAHMQKQLTSEDTRTKEEKTSQLKIINNFWQESGHCYKLDGDKETQIIIQLNKDGNVRGVWANSSSPKATCLTELAKTIIYPKPKKQPYYVKVIL